MVMDLEQQRQQAHDWLDRLPPAKLGAVHSLLEVMVDEAGEDEELTEEEGQALLASREYFRKGGQGVAFEQVVADLGFTMEQVRGGNRRGR
jgi:hypothetical protein